MTKNKKEDFQHSINKDGRDVRSYLSTTTKFSEKLLLWYTENKRDLPWRYTKDPYKIWLSEIILQQTRVAQGLPYYLKFIERFPTVFSLAKAKEQEVLRLWQGLGYYSRARNLHHCAKEVVEKFQGKFPDNFQDLQKLRGIGSYTAAAIASISFREPVAVPLKSIHCQEQRRNFLILNQRYLCRSQILLTKREIHFRPPQQLALGKK